MAKRTINTIELRAEALYILRSTFIFPDGHKSLQYYESPSMWNKSPAMATIFTTYEAADAHLNMYAMRDRAKLGWADGQIEHIDVVPLFGELTKSTKVSIIRK